MGVVDVGLDELWDPVFECVRFGGDEDDTAQSVFRGVVVQDGHERSFEQFCIRVCNVVWVCIVAVEVEPMPFPVPS